MGLKRTDEFRQDAVRIALTIGLTIAWQHMLACVRGRLLKEERDILKKATYYPAGDDAAICREGRSSRAKSHEI